MAKQVTLEAGEFGVEHGKLVALVGRYVMVRKASGQDFEGVLEAKTADSFQIKTGKRGKPPVFFASEVDQVVAA